MHYSTEVGTLQQLFMNSSEFSDKCDNIQSQRQMRALFIGPPMDVEVDAMSEKLAALSAKAGT